MWTLFGNREICEWDAITSSPTYEPRIPYGLATSCLEKVQVGKDQEKAQSEKDSHSKNRGGKKKKTKQNNNQVLIP